MGLPRRYETRRKALRESLAAVLVLAETEARWQASYDSDRLRAEVLSVDLWAGLEPYPEGWRARVRKPETLPHFPMVLHRGGYPDGS